KCGINSRQCHSTQPISSIDNSLCQLTARSPLTSVNSRSVAEFPGQNFPAFVGVNTTLRSKLISRKLQTRRIGEVGSATKSSYRARCRASPRTFPSLARVNLCRHSLDRTPPFQIVHGSPRSENDRNPFFPTPVVRRKGRGKALSWSDNQTAPGVRICRTY